MAVFSGPEIPNDGLIFSLDAANPKNFDLTAVEVLVVAGGGSGAQAHGTNTVGGGGGGGVVHKKNHAVTPGTSHTVTIGAGGTAPGTNYVAGANGGNSVFDTLTALGGGGGGVTNGVTGGSGSGAGSYNGSASVPFSGAAATQPGSASSGFGFSGGSCIGNLGGGGGGGGAGEPGESSLTSNGGRGGNGYFTNISGTYQYYAGGGGGTGWEATAAGIGGLGGGGNGATRGTGTVTNATPNTGGGGGSSKNGYGEVGGNGGSGIVIVRYPAPQRAIGGTVTQVGNDIVHTFTTVGNSTFTPISSSNLLGASDLTKDSFLTNNGNTSYSASNGGIFTFNGSSSYFSIPNSDALNTTLGLTIEAWVKFDLVSDDFIFEKGDVNTQYSLFSHGAAQGDDIVFRTYHSGDGAYHSQSRLKADVGIVNGQWVHIVGSWDGSNKRIYVNGVLKDTVAKSGALVTTTKGASVGRFGGDTAGYFFNGSISKVSVYNRGLTSTEVFSCFSASRDRYGV